jgi:hypothetical protein
MMALPNITSINMKDNLLTGAMPSMSAFMSVIGGERGSQQLYDLRQRQTLKVTLSKNFLTGDYPVYALRKTDHYVIDLDNNFFCGPLPIYYSDEQMTSFDFRRFGMTEFDRVSFKDFDPTKLRDQRSKLFPCMDL